jgi:DNA repair exonuclease SbcCD ATPase subunit
MKRITLERLALRNFKGFREFTLSANGGNVDAFGDNGTGKTTLFDAFTWKLFGKDSANRADFEIKELDSFGKVRQHKLDHEVEGVLIVNGRRKSFRRVYAEKWTKKRGALTDSFEGHETAYYVDGVPVAKKDYDSEVGDLIQEELFKLLTSPTYFNEQLRWQDRRKLLIEVCGNVTDAEVIHSNKQLDPLEAILRERDIDKHKAIVAERMKRINTEIKDIPTRISEAQRGMPDVSELSEELLLEDIETLRRRAMDKEQELMRVQSGGQVSELERRLREIDSEQLGIKTRLQSSVLDQIAYQRDKVATLQRELDRLRRMIDDQQYKIRTNEQHIASLEQQRAVLRTDFTTKNADEFVHHHDETCEACGQLMPEHKRHEAHEKAQSAFNRRKADHLADIQKRGHAAREESERLDSEIKRYQIEIEAFLQQRESVEGQLQPAEAELDRLRKGIQDPSSDPGYQALASEADGVHGQIAALRADSEQAQSELRQIIKGVRSEIASYEAERAKFDQVRKQEERIAELEQQEKALAAEYERLQHEQFLMEEFTRAKVNMLQTRIDSKFKYARFRLFEEQVNGGLKEVCETLFNGVPYTGGLNNAARINVGLDIINTLSQHFGVTAPIFIDNAEAVTSLIDTDAQVIRLVVSEQDKQLRVVTTNSMQEAI